MELTNELRAVLNAVNALDEEVQKLGTDFDLRLLSAEAADTLKQRLLELRQAIGEPTLELVSKDDCFNVVESDRSVQSGV